MFGPQFKPEFLAISPNNKIPGITDAKTGVTIFESGAILQYLADTYGAFFPADVKERAEVNAWLFWSCASLSPILGQVGHFISPLAPGGPAGRGLPAQTYFPQFSSPSPT